MVPLSVHQIASITLTTSTLATHEEACLGTVDRYRYKYHVVTQYSASIYVRGRRRYFSLTSPTIFLLLVLAFQEKSSSQSARRSEVK
jgi:hypothetical protein